jgi:hypothetical protein
MIHIAKPDAELLDALETAGVLDSQSADALKPAGKKRLPKPPAEKPPKPPREKPAGKPARAKPAPRPQPIKPAGPPPALLDLDDLLSAMPILWIILAIGLIVGLAIAR